MKLVALRINRYSISSSQFKKFGACRSAKQKQLRPVSKKFQHFLGHATTVECCNPVVFNVGLRRPEGSWTIFLRGRE